MINLHENMKPGQDQTYDPLICNQTLYLKAPWFQREFFLKKSFLH